MSEAGAQDERTPEAAGSRRRLTKPLLIATAVAVAGGGLALWLVRGTAGARAERLSGEAAILRRIGNLEEAVRVLERAVALAPRDAELASQLAEVRIRLGEVEAGERVLREALERLPGEPIVAVPLASSLLARGRAEEADRLLEPLTERLRGLPEPGDRARALALAGRCAHAAGRAEPAEALLREAADVPGAPAPLTTRALLALATLLEAADRRGEAIAACRLARERLPEDVEVAIALARLLDLDGRRAEAIDELGKIAALDSADALRAVPALCDLLIRAGRLPDAVALGERVAARPEGPAAAAYVRGAVALARGDDADAETEFARMAQLLPGATRPRILVALVARRRRAPERARAAFEAALQIEPGLPEAEVGLLELDLHAGALDAVRARAERLLEQPALRAAALRAIIASYSGERDAPAGLAKLEAIAARLGDDPLVRLAVAVFRVRTGDTRGGIEELSRLIEGSPDLPGVFAALAAAQEQRAGTLEAIEELARHAEADPRFAPARVVLARLFARVGRPDLAARELGRAIEERPDLREARLERAMIRARSGEADGAIDDLEAIRRTAPGDAQIATVLSELRIALGDADGAASVLADAVAAAPGDARLRARLARAQALAGRTEEALATFAAAREMRATLPEAHEDGALRLARGEHAEAVAALERALRETGDPRFAGALAVARALSGDAGAGIEPITTWRTRATTSVEGAMVHAMLLALSGDRRRAADVAESVPVPAAVEAAAVAARTGAGGAIDPQTRVALELFGLGALGWQQQVRERAERVAADGGAGALLAWWAMRAYGRRGDAQVRLALTRRAAELAPTDPSLGLELAHAQHQAGDADAQLATLRLYARRFPDDPRVALGLGMALQERGNPEAAVEQYTRAALAPRPSPIALNNLAYLLAGDPDRRSVAIAHARRAAGLAPLRGELLDTLGYLLHLDEQHGEAETTLERAVSVTPDDPTIRYHLALALDARGKPTRAIDHLKMALMSRDEFAERTEAADMLERLERELASTEVVAEDAPVLAAGASLEVVPDAAGLAVVRIEPAGGDDVEARLRYRGPSSSASVVSIVVGGKIYKRLEADAGGEVVLPRFALPTAPAVAIARVSAPAGGEPFTLSLQTAAGDSSAESEPDSDPAGARRVALGEEQRGALDGPGDRDHLRLELTADERATATVAAGSRGEVSVELIELDAAGERKLKRARVPAGGEVTLSGILAPPGGGALALRIAPGGPLARPASGTPAAGAGVDYRVRLRPDRPSTDVEPNDRVGDAIAVAPGAPVAATVGPGDPIDWYRVEAAPGATLRLRLRAEQPGRTAGAPAELAIELWERTELGVLPIRRYMIEQAELTVPRWRTPARGELLIAAISPRWAEGPARYELVLEAVDAGHDARETEPNDRPELADAPASGDELTAALDVAGDRDWALVPAGATARAPLAIELDAGGDFVGGTVSVFARDRGQLRFIAGFDASGGALRVPALALPEGDALVSVSTAGAALGPYRLRLGPARAETGLEAEPNDDLATALELTPGRVIRGRISGRADRDLVVVDGGRPLLVRSTGEAAVAIAVLGRGAPARVVEPGRSVTIDPAELGRAERVVVELLAPRPEGVSGIARAIESARAGIAYELRTEAGR